MIRRIFGNRLPGNGCVCLVKIQALLLSHRLEITKLSTIFSARCLLAVVGLIAVGSACGQPTLDSETRVRVSTVTVAPASVSLAVGQTQQLSATLGDAAGNMLSRRPTLPTLVKGGPTQRFSAVIGDAKGRTGRIVTWSSSQPSRVTVDGGGMVRALAVGSARVTATSGGKGGVVKVIVREPSVAPVTVIPISASLSVGETLQLTAALQDSGRNLQMESINWKSSQPTRATVDGSGVVTAIAAGTATITATSRGEIGTAALTITPATKIYGLDFPGNAGANTTIRFEFRSALPAYPATYIWRAYPRQQESYYTAFFWGNNGAFYGTNTYYGFHPYPDWNTDYQHFWEIAAPPGRDFVSSTHVVYDHWYTQVAVCDKSGSTTVHEFYWDWPDTTKVVRHTGAEYSDPPRPGLVVGDAPWNQGHEVWDGILRGFQFYDAALTRTEIAREVVSPGSARTPWYLSVNPTPSDILDKSGNEHHPVWVGDERPSLWTGRVDRCGIIRTTVPPR